MRGLSYPIFSVGVINSLFFGAYTSTLSAICHSADERDRRDTPSYSQVVSAGCVAGAVQLVLAVPVDLIKVRLQAHQGDVGGGDDGCNLGIQFRPVQRTF